MHQHSVVEVVQLIVWDYSLTIMQLNKFCIIFIFFLFPPWNTSRPLSIPVCHPGFGDSPRFVSSSGHLGPWDPLRPLVAKYLLNSLIGFSHLEMHFEMVSEVNSLPSQMMPRSAAFRWKMGITKFLYKLVVICTAKCKRVDQLGMTLTLTLTKRPIWWKHNQAGYISFKICILYFYPWYQCKA